MPTIMQTLQDDIDKKKIIYDINNDNDNDDDVIFGRIYNDDLCNSSSSMNIDDDSDHKMSENDKKENDISQISEFINMCDNDINYN